MRFRDFEPRKSRRLGRGLLHYIVSVAPPHCAATYALRLMRARRSCGSLVLVEVSLHEKNSSDFSRSVGVLSRTIRSSSGQFWNPVALPVPCLDPFRLFRARVLRQLRPRGLFRIVLQLSQCRLLRIFGRLLPLPVRDRLLSQLLQRQRLLSALLAAGLQQWLLSAWVLRPEILLPSRAIKPSELKKRRLAVFAAVLQLCRSGLICWANAPCVIGFRSVQVEAIRTGSHPSGSWLVSAFFLVVPGRRGVACRARSARRSRHGVALGPAVCPRDGTTFAL